VRRLPLREAGACYPQVPEIPRSIPRSILSVSRCFTRCLKIPKLRKLNNSQIGMKVAFFAVQSTPGRLLWETPRDCQEGSDKRHETTCESVQYRDDFESYVQVRPAV
jgi:hypothetical protein